MTNLSQVLKQHCFVLRECRASDVRLRARDVQDVGVDIFRVVGADPVDAWHQVAPQLLVLDEAALDAEDDRRDADQLEAVEMRRNVNLDGKQNNIT